MAFSGDFGVFEWKRRWQMEFDFGFEFTDAACDFEDTILNGIKLRVRPLCGLESCFGKGVHQDISGAMQEETEVIGFEGVTGGAIGMEKGFVILDEISHPAARTIDGFVEE